MKRVLAFLAVGALACVGGPQAMQLRSERPPRDAYRCVTEIVESEGFTVTEDRRSEGLLEAVGVYERPDTSSFLGLETVENEIEWGWIQVRIVEEANGGTGIVYSVGTSLQRDGPWGEPSVYMQALVSGIPAECS